MIKLCVVCETAFSARSPRYTRCSEKCRKADVKRFMREWSVLHRTANTKECLECGAVFRAKTSEKHCGADCRKAHNKKQKRKFRVRYKDNKYWASEKFKAVQEKSRRKRYFEDHDNKLRIARRHNRKKYATIQQTKLKLALQQENCL